MSVAATTAPAKGWYPDPQDDAQLRWWDGAGWTAHTIERPRPKPEPEASPRVDRGAPAAAEPQDDRVREPAPDWIFDLVREERRDEEPIEFSWDDTIETDALEPSFRADVVAEDPKPLVRLEPLTFAARRLALAPDMAALEAAYAGAALVGPRRAAGPDFGALAAVYAGAAFVGPRCAPGPDFATLAAAYAGGAFVGPRRAAGPDFKALAAAYAGALPTGPRPAPVSVPVFRVRPLAPAPDLAALAARYRGAALVGPRRAPAPPAPPRAPVSFVFRARPLAPTPEQVADEVVTVPVYESPLAVIRSPLPAPLPVAEQPTLELAPAPAPAPVVHEAVAEPEAAEEPQVARAPEPEPGAPAEAPTVESPALVLPPPPAPRRGVPRVALAGTAGVAAAAAVAAGITNLISGDPEPASGGAAAAISAADRACLKEWNTTASGSAAQLRVTLGQFSGALARVQRVDPLPGTLMTADSCALTVYDPATDTNAVFVSGVQDQIGYVDVTSYPRAKRYGWPKSEKDANVEIREDGSIAAL